MIAAVVGALMVAGCGSSSGGRVAFYLTDAPLDGAKEVNVVVKGIEVVLAEEVNADAGETESGKITIAIDRTLNLLDFRDGRRTLLGETDVPGRIGQVRLLTDGTATVVFEDGSTRVARVPSAAQSGVKIILGNIDPATTGEITLDFDAAKSIHETGNGELIMRPTIKALVQEKVIAESEPTEPTEPSEPVQPL